jgi:hypothetical protein
MLYSNMVAINPVAARLWTSFRASQQAAPRESKAAPATRLTANALGVSSVVPNRNETGNAGETTSARPVPASRTAVTMSRAFIVASFRGRV